jgi:N-acetylglucosamine malate deacetylase 1
MLAHFKKVLILAPHTDDGELGCGGTIAKMIENGTEVYYVAFSACEISVPDGFPKDILIREVKKATLQLGIKPENLRLLQYDVRTFNYHRQAILDDILLLKKEINPDLVFIPALHDIHQDHATIANEAHRAFKFSNILCYELPWNNFNFNTTLFVQLEERHINAKKAAMRAYESQAHRPYANDTFIQSLAVTRGVQSGNTYAEVFEVIRLIM